VLLHFSRSGRVALGVLVGTFVALPAAADLAAWDQARTTQIARELAHSCDAFEQAVRDQPGMGVVGSGSAEAGLGLKELSRALRDQSRALADHLADGKGHDQTLDEWRGLKEVSDSVEERADQTELDNPTLDAWATVADQMRQLAPYYDPKADTE
jgi:hypothetical protein